MKIKKDSDSIRKTQKLLVYKFSDKELLEISKAMAEKNTEVRLLYEQKERIAADFKSKITAAESDISVASNKISSGYEMRMVDCEMHLDTPKKGKKQIIRLDSNTLAGVEDMSQDEMQRMLALEEEHAGTPTK